MPNQQTPAQSRVIDPILSSIVRGYKHPQNVLTEALFPFVDVTKRGGTRIEFGVEDFRAVNTQRAPGSRIAEVQFGHAGLPYALTDHALAAKVPQEMVQESAGTPASDQMGRANISVMRIMLLELERAQAALATTAGSYAAGNKVTLTAGTEWSDITSDIIGMVEDWKAAVRAKIGMDPNTLILPWGCMKAIKKHTQLKDLLKVTDGVPTLQHLQDALEIERIFRVGSISSDGSAFSDVWGDFGLLAYVEANPSSAGEPSFGYTYRMAGHPSATPTRWDPDTKSWKSDVEFTRSPEIVGIDSGYLVSTIING